MSQEENKDKKKAKSEVSTTEQKWYQTKEFKIGAGLAVLGVFTAAATAVAVEYVKDSNKKKK